MQQDDPADVGADEASKLDEQMHLTFRTWADELDDLDFDLREARRTKRPMFRSPTNQAAFTLGAINAFAIAYLSGAYPWVVPLFYSVKFPILICARIVYYCKMKWHYFVLDFCYWGNALLLLYLWIFPDSPRLFSVVYSVTHGPMAWAVLLFSNSLVFHSFDKITSCYIHISPLIVTHLIRWNAESSGHRLMSRYSVCTVESECSTWMWTLVLPWGVYVAQHLVYLFLIKVACPIPKDDAYLTSFRYLTRAGPLARLRRMRGGWLVYGALNMALAFVMLVPVYLWHHVYAANFTFVAVICATAIYNGGGFYARVFAKHRLATNTPRAAAEGSAVVTVKGAAPDAQAPVAQ